MFLDLRRSDRRVQELVGRTGQTPSLVSYHLGRLRAAGLVTVRRSAADGRDAYYALDLDAVGGPLRGVAGDIPPGVLGEGGGDPDRRASVLFVCTGNSSRSQMA